VFLPLQARLPESARIALDFFMPFRQLGLSTLIAQAIRAALMALVLYPFYGALVQQKQGFWLLFGALWGLALVGSLEPFPGSIEGMIYTITTLREHVMILAMGAVQVSLFCWLFLKWEGRNTSRSEAHV
jgi:hypothetical protein